MEDRTKEKLGYFGAMVLVIAGLGAPITSGIINLNNAPAEVRRLEALENAAQGLSREPLISMSVNDTRNRCGDVPDVKERLDGICSDIAGRLIEEGKQFEQEAREYREANKSIIEAYKTQCRERNGKGILYGLPLVAAGISSFIYGIWNGRKARNLPRGMAPF